jgi:hypothetical protein
VMGLLNEFAVEGSASVMGALSKIMCCNSGSLDVIALLVVDYFK